MSVPRVAHRALIVCLLLAGLVAVASRACADAKIGYIDSVRILADYKGVEDAKRAFDDEVKQWEDEEVARRATIDSLTVEFKSQNLMLTEATRKEREATIRQKKTEYEQFVRSIWGQEGKVVQKNAELMKPIIDKVNVILERLGAEENFTVIFDAAGGGIVYASPGIDLTDKVVAELNKGVE